MPQTFAALLCCFVVGTELGAVEPIPESKQAALSLKILEKCQTSPPKAPKKLHLVYFTPSDREPEPGYQQRLDAIMEDIRAFYRDGMEQAGFGPKTFDLDRDKEGKLILHLVKGKKPEKNYHKPDAEKVLAECRPGLKAAGISLEAETVLIFCNLANWDEKARTFSHHSPYYGYGNHLCFALDSVIQNLDDIPKKEPMLDDDEYGKMSLGKFNTIFIGGIAHELGHALSLPHCGERWNEKSRGTSLMGAGNHTYREERRREGPGSFLTMASAMKLASNPLFSKADTDASQSPKLDQSDFQLSTNLTSRDLAARPGALRVEGTVKGAPPVYGVIAYFDSLHDGGYVAPTATAVPDADGRFAIEISDLAPCRDGELRFEYCHANGMFSGNRARFSVLRDRSLDLQQFEVAKALEPMSKAVVRGKLSAAQAELGKLEKGNAPALAKTIGRKLVGTLQDQAKRTPAETSPDISELALGDARAEVAEVGWGTPAANRIPQNPQIESPLLDCGKIYATGLFAHSPSRYVFDLGGKWESLRGDAGLHTVHQPYAAGVVFVIKTDNKEVFRSAVIRGSTTTNYQVDLKGVSLLELIVEQPGNSNHNNWSLWLDPTLFRSERTVQE